MRFDATAPRRPHLGSGPSTLPGASRRNHLKGVLALGALLLLSACAAPPQPPEPAPAPGPTRGQALEDLGFRPTDEGWEFSLNGKLLFDSDSDQLDAESQGTADRLGRELAILGVEKVRIEGHTDSKGGSVYNQTLSLRRAQAVARAMAAAGLHNATIEVHGLGKGHPVSSNSTAEQRQQNRRVAVVVPAQ